MAGIGEALMRILRLLVIGLGLVLGAPAWAGDREDCAQDNDLDLSIAGCTAIIDAATDTATNIFRAYYYRGNAYAVKAQYDHAIEDYDRAIALNPSYAIGPYFSRGFAYFKKGQYDPGIFKKGQYNRAIQDLDRAIALNPNFAAAYVIRGLAHEQLGKPDSAEADISKALALNRVKPMAGSIVATAETALKRIVAAKAKK
jgi:tetratricopeptide (TPR) repeat protein